MGRNKKKSEFLRTFGIVWHVWTALVNAVQDLGGGDEDVRRIETDATLCRDLAQRIMQGSAVVKSEPRPVIPAWRHVDDHTIEVNLDAAPKLPFDNAKVEWPKSPAKKGWVTVQRRDDDLYVNDRKVVLHLEEGQKTGTVVGHELRRVFEGKDVLHLNVLDALFDNPYLIPESWKQDEQGRPRYIYFWAVGFRGAGGSLYVRFLYWLGGRWCRSCGCLDGGWGALGPAALLAS